MLSYENKFKEKNPIETIKKTIDILLDLNMLFKTSWSTPIKGIYSVNLQILNSSIYTNGKGNSVEYAFASACGEMMERLQNLTAYRFSFLCDYSINNYKYKLDKQEVITNTIDKLDKQRKFLKMLFDEKFYQDNINYWNYILKGQDIVNTIFKNILQESDFILIPEPIYVDYYGSNGMVAGNTYAEAFVQGISEILERYAVKKVLTDKLTPPDITVNVCENYPKIAELINSIKSVANNISLQIKDLNLGIGLPVFAVVYMDKSSLKSFVNFGSHPNVEIGIERCLTELYQGHNSVKIENALHLYEEINSQERNMHSIFETGEGIYPLNFYGTNPSFNKLDLSKLNFLDNHEMCRYYINLIESLGHSIYYQDVGFLGFPALSLVIPGMSEVVYDNNEISNIKRIEQGRYIFDNYRDLDNLSSVELKKFAECLESKNLHRSISLDDFLKLPIKEENNHFKDITLDLLLTMVYIRLSEYDKAKEHLDDFIKYIMSEEASEYAVNYNILISTILRFKIENVDDEEIINILKMYCFEEQVLEAIDDLLKDNIFNGLPKCVYPNCDLCHEKNNCCVEKDSSYINALLKKKFEYTPKQSLISLLVNE